MQKKDLENFKWTLKSNIDRLTTTMHTVPIPKELSRLKKRVEELHNRNETLMKELEKAS